MFNDFLEDDNQFLKAFDAISESNFYKRITPELGYQHKIGHIQKVMLFSKIIAQNESLDEQQTKILLASAAFHDSGRIKDRDNGEHGKASAEIAGEYFKNNYNNPYGITQNEIAIVQTVIAYHVIIEKTPGQIDEKELEKICHKYGIYNLKNFKNVKKISAILKDADALDRLRFSSKKSSRINLDTKFLRTETAKKQYIIELARLINQAYAGYILRENYSNESAIDNDNAKTLQVLRHNFRINNGGIRKREKEIPTKIVKLLFRYGLQSIKIVKSDYVNSKEKDIDEREV